MSKLFIIRGIPGSGKSTYAKSLGIFHVEADMFFMHDGKYEWSGDKIKLAHAWCKDMVWNAMFDKMDVAVSNTFTQYKEFSEYIAMARENGYKIEVITCTGNYGNTHGVPEETLNKMKSRWELYPGEVIK